MSLDLISIDRSRPTLYTTASSHRGSGIAEISVWPDTGKCSVGRHEASRAMVKLTISYKGVVDSS